MYSELIKRYGIDKDEDMQVIVKSLIKERNKKQAIMDNSNDEVYKMTIMKELGSIDEAINYYSKKSTKEATGICRDVENKEEEFDRAIELLATPDYEKGIRVLEELASRGNVFALEKLGKMYLHGERVEKNPEKGLMFFTQAAEKENAVIQQLNLGIIYYMGDGVQIDKEKAAYWFRKSAEGGFGPGQINLGVCYENGDGVGIDYEKAVYWYKQAAEQGQAYAQLNLGQCYQNGKGVGIDKEKAKYWLRKSAEQGNTDAQDSLRSFDY